MTNNNNSSARLLAALRQQQQQNKAAVAPQNAHVPVARVAAPTASAPPVRTGGCGCGGRR